MLMPVPQRASTKLSRRHLSLCRVLSSPAIFLLFATQGATGCGGGSIQMMVSPPPPQPPQIVTQPASQTVPIGLTASFTVAATGTAPLAYQWGENSAPLADATNSTYDTSTVGPADNGSTFTVTVTNAAGSITSSPATLSVGARSPKPGDLRFQQVDAPSLANGYAPGDEHTNILPGLAINFGNNIGSPFTIGGNCAAPTAAFPYDCAWFFSTWFLPAAVSGLSVQYQSTYDYSDLDFDLRALGNPNTVVTGLDLQPANNTYAISSIQTTGAGGFEQFRQTALPANFPVAAAQAGLQSQVITAVSFDANGDVYYVSYGWQTDTTTLYDVTVVNSTFDNIATSAANLAAEGYIITALGGNFTNGFLLVGTRVQGDTLPRPFLLISLQSGSPTLGQAEQEGYALVGYLVSADGTNSFFLGEK